VARQFSDARSIYRVVVVTPTSESDFDVPSADYANMSPLSRFRLAPSGDAVVEAQSGPRGFSIVRYALDAS